MSALPADVMEEFAASENDAQSLDVLARAFERFSESSARLETRYQEIVREAEELRKQLAAKNRELERSEKLATLGEMAAAIAHEVRNPLGAMRLFLSLLREDVQDRAGALEMVDQLDRGITTLNGVVSNILQFSRQGPLVRSVMNLHPLVLEQVALFEAGNLNGCTFVTSLQGNPFVNGNETALRQVVHNLVDNAVRAVNGRGRVEISVRDLDEERVRIEVRDDGPGIPAEVLERLFEPFVTTRSEGTGLGLAIVRQVIVHHGGTVGARNDGGAVFEITLPRQGAHPPINQAAKKEQV